MSVKELSNNQTTLTLLLAAFVAGESYFLSLIAAYAVGRFWLSNIVLHLLSVLAAYIIMDAIVKRANWGGRKKAVVAVVVLTITIVAAIAMSIITLYLNKLQLQAMYN